MRLCKATYSTVIGSDFIAWCTTEVFYRGHHYRLCSLADRAESADSIVQLRQLDFDGGSSSGVIASIQVSFVTGRYVDVRVLMV